MNRSRPKPPTEDPSAAVLRERQVRDLADLDEEENRRIKAALTATRGVRAFRRSVGGRGRGSVTPSTTDVQRNGQRAFRSSRSGDIQQ